MRAITSVRTWPLDRLSYDGKTVEYGSAEDLLGRIRTVERQIAGADSRPIVGFSSPSRGDR